MSAETRKSAGLTADFINAAAFNLANAEESGCQDGR